MNHVSFFVPFRRTLQEAKREKESLTSSKKNPKNPKKTSGCLQATHHKDDKDSHDPVVLGLRSDVVKMRKNDIVLIKP